MKILFFGDVMFGRNNNPFIINPFKYIQHYFNNVDLIIFNLETVILPRQILDNYKVNKVNKVFDYVSNGKQLIKLRQLTNKPIIASINNNHSLDYDVYGLNNTKKFLQQHHIHFTNFKSYLELDNIIYFNFSDHCGCDDINYWAQFIDIIDYNDYSYILNYIKILKSKKRKKKIIVSIHWGSNWLDKISNDMTKLGIDLIDSGVDIIFGHSAHHIPPIVYEYYKKGIIIYGLGDLINDYSVKQKYESNLALMCILDTNNLKNIKLIEVNRTFVEQGSSIPIPL